MTYEFTFGTTACEVEAEKHITVGGEPFYTATAFVWENDGKELRAVGDREGQPVKRRGSDENHAAGRVNDFETT